MKRLLFFGLFLILTMICKNHKVQKQQNTYFGIAKKIKLVA